MCRVEMLVGLECGAWDGCLSRAYEQWKWCVIVTGGRKCERKESEVGNREERELYS